MRLDRDGVLWFDKCGIWLFMLNFALLFLFLWVVGFIEGDLIMVLVFSCWMVFYYLSIISKDELNCKGK